MDAGRILFVDDEECIAESSGELLTDLGYTVTSVTSSLAALEIFRADPERFDLVFTDLTMPQLSGLELAAQLRRIRPDIAIVLCSGYSASVSAAEIEAAGIRAVCMKPTGIQKLDQLARAILAAPARPDRG